MQPCQFVPHNLPNEDCRYFLQEVLFQTNQQKTQPRRIQLRKEEVYANYKKTWKNSKESISSGVYIKLYPDILGAKINSWELEIKWLKWLILLLSQKQWQHQNSINVWILSKQSTDASEKKSHLRTFFNTSTSRVWCCERVVIIQYHLISRLAVGFRKTNYGKMNIERYKVATSSGCLS